MTTKTVYDYIIAGAGCAGLSLAMHMMSGKQFSNKKILIVDRAAKDKNDRTWCFWEQAAGLFEPIVSRSWKEVWFHSQNFSRLLNLAPFQYKMIRGLEFYKHCFTELKKHPGIEIVKGNIDKINATDTSITLNGHSIRANYIFNSILFDDPQQYKKELYLLQHFKGWMIETPIPQFNPSAAVLMDFRVPQQHGTTFAYVLPVSPTRAMVEYTLFSENVLNENEYDSGLKNYISHCLNIPGYTILEEEFGIIPMTNRRFAPAAGHVINIGTAGGMTKPSSGYTFYFIQKHSRAIVEALIRTGTPPEAGLFSKRFSFFDSVLLNVLSTGKLAGDKVFTALFKKNKPSDILFFLNNESSTLTDLKIISSLPALPFLKAGLQQL